ncbi:MAG TPA: CocE/NonD family hydrolase [Polyangia bacterium]|nr:CocE/NonD family hydrolase [Polyangia bacterium]
MPSSTLHSTSRSSSRLTVRRPVTAVALTLLLSIGCGTAAGDDPAAIGPTQEMSSVEALRVPGPPARAYTDSELEALAESPEVEHLKNPWVAAPPADRSFYVPMSDGIRRAVNLYLPAGFDDTTSQAPVIFVDAWYGRGLEVTGTAVELYRAAGFVVAIADLRGMGASFGAQPTFVTPEIRRDQNDLIAWFRAQSWSNGQVVAVGISISSTYAEAMTASGAPGLRAAIVRASDFDQYTGNVFPGGIPNPRMMGLVADVSEWMLGAPCVDDLAVCGQLGIEPVASDLDLTLFQAAMRDHQANFRGTDLVSLVFKDDAVGSGTIRDMNPADHVAEMRRAAVPARVSASWLDGTTAESTLARFQALPEVPMEVSIGATTHIGGLDADPFSRTPFQAARPGAPQQFAADVAFVQRVLGGEAIGHSVSYYVLGAGVWKRTSAWPPAGVRVETLRLSHDQLQPVDSGRGGPDRAGERSYQVDPTTSSGGRFNRWASQQDFAVFYGDRRAAPGRRLSFDGAPITRDTELVGAPELCLAMRTDHSDGTVFAYLEDVAPDGRVTYLTEGELRLLHRKIQGSSGSGGCDPAPGSHRSFDRADGEAVTPGQAMRIEIPLQPTAALIRRGHRIRLSLAGADAGTFPALTEGPETWIIGTGGAEGSTLSVPVRAWSR